MCVEANVYTLHIQIYAYSLIDMIRYEYLQMHIQSRTPPPYEEYCSPLVHREPRHDSVNDPTPEIIKGEILHFIFVQRDGNLHMLKRTITHVQIVKRTRIHTRILIDMTDILTNA